MIKIKKLISLLVIVLVAVYVYFNYKPVLKRIMMFFEPPKPVIKEGNSYTKNIFICKAYRYLRPI